MTISLNWLKEYIDIKLSPDEISNLLTSLGLEVEGMEEVESIKSGLEGVVVGEVKECWRHPNADKLNLTKVDIVGAGELLQIVCGAPNVAAGQRVLVATIGTTLYPTGGEPLTLKLGKLGAKNRRDVHRRGFRWAKSGVKETTKNIFLESVHTVGPYFAHALLSQY